METRGALKTYKQLWNNRALPIETNEENTLMKAIETELNDEMTHPRLRKSRHEKFHQSVKRILLSSLDESEKLTLIRLYTQVLDQLVNDDKEN